MATGTLTNYGAGGTLTFYDDQNNTFTLKTADKYTETDIELTTKVTKAVLNDDPNDLDHKTFTIQIPNGDANDIYLLFTTYANGNTVVTGGNVTT